MGKRLLSLFISALFAVQTAGFAVASAETSAVAQWDFEDGTVGGWEGFGTGNEYISNISFANAEEDGNKFARISYKTLKSGENSYGDNLPSARYTLENPIKFESGEIVNLSARIRTNYVGIGEGTQERPGIGMGINFFHEIVESNENGNHCMIQYGYNTFWNTDGSEIRMRYGYEPWGAHWPYWLPFTSVHTIGRLNENEWTDFDVSLKIGANNKPEQITVSMNGVQAGTAALTEENSLLGQQTELSSIHFFTYIAAAAYEKDITYDFDDVSVSVFYEDKPMTLLGASNSSGRAVYYIDTKYPLDDVENIRLTAIGGEDKEIIKTNYPEKNMLKIETSDVLPEGDYLITGIENLTSGGIKLYPCADISVTKPQSYPFISESGAWTNENGSLVHTLNEGMGIYADEKPTAIFAQIKPTASTSFFIDNTEILQFEDGVYIPKGNLSEMIYPKETSGHTFDMALYINKGSMWCYLTDDSGEIYAAKGKTDIKSVSEIKLTDSCETGYLYIYDSARACESGVSVQGSSDKGEILLGSFEIPNSSAAFSAQWFSGEEPAEIQGANKLFMHVGDELDKQPIKLRITKLSDGSYNESQTVLDKREPQALDIKISGKMFTGETLTGSYTYYDANNDEENKDETEFCWLRGDSENGAFSPIDGAVESTYVLTEADTNKYIKFSVTPKAVNEPKTGEAAYSAALAGPAVPMAENVKIIQQGSMYIGSYTYSHIHGDEEEKSLYAWYLDGTKVSSEKSYRPTKSGRLKFEVTPISKTAPKTGEAAFAEINCSVSTGGGSGSGGGTSSGNSGQIFVTPNTKPNTTTPVINDISGHWAESVIKEMAADGIVEVGADGKFYPDTASKRSEVIVAAAKAAGVTPVDYTGIFKDVKSSDSFSGYLQALVSSGVISVDTDFRPNDNITREEMCKVLATLLKLDFTNTDTDILSVYTDLNNISDWARPYVRCAANARLMIGVESNLFAPKGNVTKAQTAKLCSNIKTLLKEDKNND